MKKISTKIVLFSIMNTTIIAAINVGVSIAMDRNRNNGAAATVSGSAIASDAAAAAQAAPGGGAPGMFGFLPPSAILIGLLVSMVLGILMAFVLGKFISRPIIQVTGLTKKTADFDLVPDDVAETLSRYRDESGAMAAALLDTRAALRAMALKLQGISSSLESHSENLTRSTDENVHTITQIVNTVSEVAEGNSSQAQAISEINSTLAEAANLMEGIAKDATIGADKAANSLDSIQDGQNAVDIQAEKMEKTVSLSLETNKSVAELGEMIGQVTSTINVITSIADQTNLLALNAAIEAARAGEAGKGFAVVADEIRKLAEESARAAKVIVNITGKTTEKTRQVMQNIDASGSLAQEQKNALHITQDAFNKMEQSYRQIVESFSDTAKAMSDINRKSRTISAQTQDMAAVAQQSAASMEEISASGQQQLSSIEEIANASKGLFALSEQLNSEMRKFKLQ